MVNNFYIENAYTNILAKIKAEKMFFTFAHKTLREFFFANLILLQNFPKQNQNETIIDNNFHIFSYT